jgi:hypothetical protein
VFVPNNGSNTVQAYTINQSTGALTSVGTAATGSSPFGVACDPTGRFVFLVNYSSSTVQSYRINNFSANSGSFVDSVSSPLISGTTVSGTTVSGTTVSGTTVSVSSSLSAPYPYRFDDISNKFDSLKTVFALRANQSAATTIYTTLKTDDIEVYINGMQLDGFVTQTTYPWLTPYASFNGYKVSGSNLILYNAPVAGDKAIVKVVGQSNLSRTYRYPFSATTVAMGD